MERLTEVVNLDNCPDKELEDVAARHEYEGFRCIARLFLKSRHYRSTGLVDRALEFEAAAEQLYAKLPKHLKW